MADVKITGLTAVTTPASGDLFALVDVSDTAQSGAGSTRKITLSDVAANLAPRVDVKQTAAANITLTVGTAAGYSWRVLGDGTVGWSASAASTVDVNLYRSAAGVLKSDHDFWAKTVSAGPTKTSNHRLWASSDVIARPVLGVNGLTGQTAALAEFMVNSGVVASVTPGGKVLATGGIGVGNSAAATTPGSVTRKMEVFNASGTSLGFVAIYSSIT